MDDFANIALNVVEDAFKKIGHATIIISGNSGVGKSTLINAIFRENIADTGIGEPVTQETFAYTHSKLPITIVDTQGFETGENGQKIYEDLRSFIAKQNNYTDPNKHIHLAWLCISEDSSRVQNSEKNFLALMDEMKIPTIVVITKAIQKSAEFKSEVRKILPSAKNWVQVLAQPYTIPTADQPIHIPTFGMDILLEVSYQVIPEGQRGALVAANKIDLRKKLEYGHRAVAVASTAAMAIGVTPIPFADATMIIPTQVSMLAAISVSWGLPVDRAFLATLVSGSISGVGTVGGRLLVSNLLKLMPGVGTIVGGGISGVTAGLITTAFGEAYNMTLYQLLKDNPDKELSVDEIRERFKINLALQNVTVS